MTLKVTKTRETQTEAGEKAYINDWDVIVRQIAQDAADYSPYGAAGNSGCASCRWFVSPDACILVSGTISPTGKSRYFAAVGEDVPSLPVATKSDERSVFEKAKEFLLGKRAAEEAEYTSFGLKEMPDGRLRYFGVVSNNFRDREKTIFSAKDHQAYVEYVEETGNYPELWYWHIPDLKLGQADWLDYNDHFLSESGYIDEGKEDLARQLASEDVAMSHGYFARWKGDVSDGYASFEGSFLPRWAVANVWTDFGLGDKGMTFNPKKREALAAKGFSEEDITKFETGVEALRAKAKEENVDFKDFLEATPPPEPKPDPEPDPVPAVLTADDIRNIVNEAFQAGKESIVTDVKALVEPLQLEVKEVKETFDERAAAAWESKAGKQPAGHSASKSDDNVVTGSKEKTESGYSWFFDPEGPVKPIMPIAGGQN